MILHTKLLSNIPSLLVLKFVDLLFNIYGWDKEIHTLVQHWYIASVNDGGGTLMCCWCLSFEWDYPWVWSVLNMYEST